MASGKKELFRLGIHWKSAVFCIYICSKWNRQKSKIAVYPVIAQIMASVYASVINFFTQKLIDF